MWIWIRDEVVHSVEGSRGTYNDGGIHGHAWHGDAHGVALLERLACFPGGRVDAFEVGGVPLGPFGEVEELRGAVSELLRGVGAGWLLTTSRTRAGEAAISSGAAAARYTTIMMGGEVSWRWRWCMVGVWGMVLGGNKKILVMG